MKNAPMSWLRTTIGAPTTFEAVLGLRPELLQLHKEFYGQLWEADLALLTLLELCRLRIAGLHDCAAELAIRHLGTGVTDAQIAALDEWPVAACFSDVERAALNLADKLPWQVRDIADGDIAALRIHLSDPQIVALTLALTLFDMHCRLRLALGVSSDAAGTEVSMSTHGTLS